MNKRVLIATMIMTSIMVLYALFSANTPYQVGTASWYGEKHHGNITASGEMYNMHDLTAAHPKLEFGTYVNVYFYETGKDVTVRINDRGPFVKGRVIDISKAAAEKIGLDRFGIGKVKLNIVEKP